jgi:hypothetical protein
MDFDAMQSFVPLGFGHITAPGALDHILFLLVLAAIHRWTEWRQALVVVTAFTVGHSLTLALAVLQPGLLPDPGIVEFLIPLTIVATGVENIVSRGVWAEERRVRIGRRALLAGGFGLVHGAGFAGYLSDIFPGSIAAPLLGFNIGIELGQLVVLTIAFAALAVVDAFARALLTRYPPQNPPRASGLRLRITAVSALVVVMGGVWAVERAPW